MENKRGVIGSGVITYIIWILVFILAGAGAFIIYKTLSKGFS